MSLTVKDLGATVLAVGVGYALYAQLSDVELPLLGSPRLLVLGLGIVGILMCILSGADMSKKSPWNVVGSLLGVASLVLVIAGLVTGNEAVLLSLMVVMLVLWALSTLRHAVVSVAPPAENSAA